MPKTPDFRRNRDIFEVVAELRKPPTLPETGPVVIASQGATLNVQSAFMNSWAGASGYGPPRFYLSEDGETRFSGRMTGGTAGTIAFVLPEWHRPEYTDTYIVDLKPTGYAKIEVRGYAESVNPGAVIVLELNP